MHWADMWGYQEQDYRSWPSVVSNQEQIIRVRSNYNGEKIKIKFSNLYGKSPIFFEKIVFCLLDSDGHRQSKPIDVTKKGNKCIVIPVKEEISFSDTVKVEFKPGDIFEIRTYLSQKIELTSGLVSYARIQQEVLNYEWPSGSERSFIDQKDCFRMVKENPRMFFIYGIIGILGFTSESQTIVAFGDSLTQQGFWIDHLKQRLLVEKFENIAVINKGIGGGRILEDTDPNFDQFQRHGRAGIKRYLNDVFECQQVDTIIILHGINDILGIKDREDMESLYRKIILAYVFYAEEAHLRGASVFIATILPLNQQSGMFSELGECLRKRVNKWITNNRFFDGVFYFDQAVEDPELQDYLKNEFDCGDGLHLSSQGGKIVADSIDLRSLLCERNLVEEMES